MSLSIKVLDCNAKCQSCYENKIRENYHQKYDRKKIIETMKLKMNDFKQVTVHGGEPLLMGYLDLKEIFKITYKKFKSTGIQTNLLVMKKRHVNLFKKYNTHVGVSVDGDNIEMNQGRGYDPHKVIENMKILRDANVKMSCIIVLRKYNAGPDNIDKLIRFIRRLKIEFGITDIRCNPGIVFDDSLRVEEELSPYDLGLTYMKLFDFIMNENGLSLQPIRDFIDGLMGYTDMTCAYGECDPYMTGAEQTIMHDGSMGNCLKSGTALDGIAGLRATEKNNARSEMLKQLDSDNFGCKDCTYWNMCHGGCPGEGIDNEWRNRSRFCEGYKMIFNHIGKKIKNLFPNAYLLPDFYPNIRKSIDSIDGSTWRKDKRKPIENIEKENKQCIIDSNGHGDHHTDEHGDSEHGDSNDPAWRRANGWN